MDDLTGYSRALYSNWLWHRPLQIVVDAGEGLSLALGSSVFAPSIVAITHGHSDHVLGLPGFAAARRFGKGANDKRWTVIYPAGATGVEAIRSAVAGLWEGVAFPVDWIPVTPGQRHRLTRTRAIEAFAVTHLATELAVGYRVVETRRRLKPEHVRLSAADIEREARRHRRDALMEEYEHVLFAHSGDAMPIDSALARDADLLVHDATFLGGAERRQLIHATTDEALQVARQAHVRTLVLNHLSVRYDRAQAIPTLRGQVRSSGFEGDCYLLDESTFVPLSGSRSSA